MFFNFKRKKKEIFDFAPILEMVRRNEIVLTTQGTPSSPENSKLGGNPFLPRDFEWPCFNDEDGKKPLSFLCQINLGEVTAYDIENLLPEKGILSFFYEAETQPWGFDPEDNSAFRAYYFENTDNFEIFDIPTELAKDLIPSERALAFEKRDSYPDFEELEFHAYIEENANFEDYDAALEDVGYCIDEDAHKLLGYADIVQSEMLTECESVSRGNYCGVPDELDPDEEASIYEHACEWILLLQLSTLEAEEYELMWGDCGKIYFYIRREDLKNKNFDNVHLVLQCN